MFIPLRAEVRVGLNKTLAKHPGETVNPMESSWQFVFFPHLTSNCSDSSYNGGHYGKGDRDSYLQKALRRHLEATAALSAFFKGLKTSHCNVVFPVPSPEPLHGCSGLHSTGLACRGRLPPGIAAAAALFSPQLYNCSSVTLSKPLCASISPTVKWRRRYFSLLRSSCSRSTGGRICEYSIYQQDNTANASIIITINIAINLLLERNLY